MKVGDFNTCVYVLLLDNAALLANYCHLLVYINYIEVLHSFQHDRRGFSSQQQSGVWFSMPAFDLKCTVQNVRRGCFSLNKSGFVSK